MKATEQYFPVVLFIMLYKVGSKFLVCEYKEQNLWNQQGIVEMHR